MISCAFIPFLIQEHEACYKHSLSLKAPFNLILIFTGGQLKQGVRRFVQNHSRSQWWEQTEKPPIPFSCSLKHKTAGAHSVVYFRHLHKNWQIKYYRREGGVLKSAHSKQHKKSLDPLKLNWEAGTCLGGLKLPFPAERRHPIHQKPST